MRGKKLSDASFLQVSFPKGWKIVVAAVHLEAIGGHIWGHAQNMLLKRNR